jgi:glycosyltransferase involved in cell wall biosynthesis
MRSADVLLATSRGEGFGLPVIEAQAVGTPVIVTNHTAQPELVRKYGHIVEGQLDYDDFQVAYYKIPWIRDIDDRLEMSWCAKRDNVIDRAALAATMDEYDADKVYAEKWEPLFRSIESGKIKLGAEAPEPVPVNRAARRGKR